MTENLILRSKVWQKSELDAELPEFRTEVGICLTRLIVFVHSNRQDLIELMPLSTPFHRTAFLIWILENAGREYHFPHSWMPAFDHRLLEVPYEGEPFSCAVPALTKLAVMRWLAHPLLREGLDLSKESDCSLLTNCGAAFFTSQKYWDLSKDIRKSASETSSWSAPGLAVPLNNLAEWIWRIRPDLQKVFPLKTLQNQASYMLWMFSSGLAELNLAPYAVSDFSCSSLKGPDQTYSDMSRIAHLSWQARPEYATEKESINARKAFCDWFSAKGETDLGLTRIMRGVTEASESAGGQILETKQTLQTNQTLQPNSDNLLSSTRKNGLNVIGALSGDFGLGEHARTTAMAALEAGIQSSLVNCFWAGNLHRYTDRSLDSITTNSADYNMSVFIAAPNGFMQQLSRIWDALHKDNYKIFYGAWELETLPPGDKEQIEFFFDEVWASSRFTFECMAKELNLPITYIPLAVRELLALEFKRFQFGLPERRFLFLYTFDGASGLPRKNPVAAIKAFQTAFPLGTEPAGLVLKTKNVDMKDPIASLLIEQVQSDKRIKLIDAHFSKEETHGLQSVCDAYISLHRAEGFGLTIAEAMLLGKPTIATNYSGNTDFCLPSTSCLVDYELVPIAPGEYRFSEGQKWAEADIESAAAHMRKLLGDKEFALRIGSAGKEYISAKHSLLSVGTQMKSRLAELSST